ncbi:MAG: hypothetical protein M4579_005136 [Chaenotheca gracillima]|nr:MAG: hypothetical protein M4579_005136 [Chaenotheca gracillima]
MAPSTASNRSFHSAGFQKLVIGRTISPKPEGNRGVPQVKSSKWHLPPGVYTPRQIVDGYAPLLEAVLHNLGPDPSNTIPARKMLLDNMASILRTDTRESSLNLPDASFDASRNEMRRQALKIGHTIVQYAAEVSEPQLDPKLNIRSPCEGHLLKQSVAQLMFGPRSQMHLMQLYNEWLHQMVLLRDALLPFDNYEEVIIPIEGTKLGLRHTEQTRSQFLLELLTKSITQKSVVTSAKALLAPRLSTSVGYGFQYEHGVILPAFLAGSPSLRLLHYFPVEVDATAKEVLFDYEFQDYYGAPRTEVSPRSGVLQENTWDAAALTAAEPNLRRAFLEVDQPGGPSTSTLLKLKLEFENDESASVDVGQISRGRRYSYRADEIEAGGNIDAKSGGTVGFTNASDVHPSTAVLSVTGQGLITTEKGGIHLIPTREAVLGLALLGKIFPENTILLSSGQSARKAETAGKTFANKPKFVIYCEDWKGIPKRGTGDEK